VKAVSKNSFSFGTTGFCVLDIETTGLSPQGHEITEIAAIRVDERFEVVSEMSRLVRTTRPVPWQITQLTGISDALLRAKGIELRRALEETWQFVEGTPSFAHNARFDRGFLDAHAERAAMPFRFPLQCSIPVFKRLIPGRKGYGLPVLAAALRVHGGGAHRALADCRVLLECLKRAHGVSR
jgi:DNA polymerase III epsilon subunit-like protein